MSAPAAWTARSDVPLARRLARAALAVTPAELPSEAMAKAKDCLIDFLACAFEARDLPWSRQALATARPAPTDAGSASIVGTRSTFSPGDAAFVNGVLGHGLVREDMHAASICHHGVVIWPTLLALSQRTPVSGAAMLVAAIVGYEAGGRIGRTLMNADLARLHRPTGLVSPLAAALAGSVLLGLDDGAATAAVAIAANTSSGLNQWPHTGGSEMYFHPGFAARNAVTAVELAEHGAYASESILEGEAGLFAAFRREPLPDGAIALFADGRPEIVSVYNKPVPACNFAQTACQAALRVAGRLGEDLGKARAILVRVPAAAARYPGWRFRGAVRARAAGQDEHPVRCGRGIAAPGRGGGELSAPRRRGHPAPHRAHATGGGRGVHAAVPHRAGRRGAGEPRRRLARDGAAGRRSAGNA
jgi:2-methylcitrate dehydratase PrpD